MEGPSLDEVRSKLFAFRDLTGPDRNYTALLAATRPVLDPGIAAHRRALHRWLNAWGCRIRYARPREPDRFDTAIKTWWARREHPLGAVNQPLALLSDEDIHLLADAFGDLSAATVAVDARGHGRTMGPTAAAKCLYALRPRSVMPWDLMIARKLHGGRDREAFAQHLELGRRWAVQALEASGLDEEHLVADLDRPGSSLAKVLDEYCYVRYTLNR